MATIAERASTPEPLPQISNHALYAIADGIHLDHSMTASLTSSSFFSIFFAVVILLRFFVGAITLYGFGMTIQLRWTITMGFARE